MPERRLLVFGFDLRVVTPLFLGGALPNERAELRPPAIKGALRDWLRLLLGAERAAGEEGALGGGAGGGAGQSPFLLSIDREVVGREEWVPPRGDRDGISGRRYLGYSLALGANPARKAIPAGVSFRLQAVFPRGGSERQRRALFASLWLLAHLGGLGTRSRRGFGSLSLEAREGGDPDLQQLPLLAGAEDHGSAVRALREALAQIRAWFVPENPAPGGSQPGPGFRLAEARVLVVPGPSRQRTWDSALDALDHVGAAMQRFRMERWVDGFATAALLAKRERLPRPPGRTAFGLPLTYRLKGQRDHSFTPYLPAAGRSDREGQDYSRFPSPLLLHVQALSGGFVAVVTLLAGARPGRDVAVREQRGRGFLAPDPSNDLLERFLERLAQDGALEVRG